eukprot:scaffold64983_cov31-Tisochrysis_lutea.AAC.4
MLRVVAVPPPATAFRRLDLYGAWVHKGCHKCVASVNRPFCFTFLSPLFPSELQLGRIARIYRVARRFTFSSAPSARLAP